MYSFSKGVDLSSLNNAIIKKVQKVVRNEAKNVLATLQRRVNFSNGSDYGDGISPYDYIGNSEESYKRWTSNITRDTSSSYIRATFENTSKHAKYIYSKARSVGHNNGFRSAYPHEDEATRRIGGRLVGTGYSRGNQLSFTKWMKFNRDVKQSMITNIKKEFKIK
jgi:hypothetical protein